MTKTIKCKTCKGKRYIRWTSVETSAFANMPDSMILTALKNQKEVADISERKVIRRYKRCPDCTASEPESDVK